MVVILAPGMTYMFAILLRLERLKALGVAALAAGLGGILLIVLPDVSLPERAMAWWLLLALLAPVLLGLGNVLTALVRPPEMPPMVLAAGMMLAAASLLIPLMAASGQFYLFHGAQSGINWNFLYATLLNAVFYLLFLEIIRLSGPTPQSVGDAHQAVRIRCNRKRSLIALPACLQMAVAFDDSEHDRLAHQWIPELVCHH
ncbi:MAG: hypothetical protein IH988_06195, partial [Planctomycetes bacterium]|nr:hypothetical protein [Planctomycetota bacterium]